MRLAVRVRSGVRWHDHRAFGVLDVQATIEPLLRAGTDAPALRAALADVASIELVTERTIRFVLKRPSDLALRALCDVPILPDHLIRGVRARVVADRAPADRHRTVPVRRLGARQAHPPRALARTPGDRRPASTRSCSTSTPTPCARSTAPGGARSTSSPHVLDVHYPDQVEPTTLHGTTALVRLPTRRYSFLRRQPPALPAVRSRASGARSPGSGIASASRGELHAELARPIGGPPLAGDIPAAPVDRARAVAPLEEAGYRDTDADGVRDHLGRPIRMTLLEPAGNRLFNVEARAFVLEMRKAGLLVDVVPADTATIMARLKRGDFDLCPMTWQGAARRGSDRRSTAPRAPSTTAVTARARSTPCSTRPGRRRGPRPRARSWARIARLIADDQPVIFLYQYDVPALVATRVRGLAAVGDRFDLRRVWLE